jgi:hypothetical protein
VKITDPRWNAHCDAWAAIRSIAEFCPRCADGLEARAQSMDTASLDEWKTLVEDGRHRYRMLVASFSREGCLCGREGKTTIDRFPTGGGVA